MSGVTRMRKTSVQRGAFLVLTSPDIPSLLVETAYISNPREESALRDPSYQRDLARSVTAGVDRLSTHQRAARDGVRAESAAEEVRADCTTRSRAARRFRRSPSVIA